MKKLRYLDGFSGYGGFCLGLLRAGFEFDEVFFSEIDKHAIANYSHNFPNHKHVGSITDVSRASIGDIDLFTFGWPCQDNSIAGKRKGQSGGTRSGLLHEAVRIIDQCRPTNFIAENVLGLLSVNGGVDFIQSLELLTYLNQELPQYDIEMQLLNTRWVLPQNRERLFFVGHLRGSGSRQIFPIGEDHCLRNKSRSVGETIHETASCLTAKGNSNNTGSFIQVASATVSGFEVAGEGDSINYSVPGSKTRRGRVGYGVAQTLDTGCSQAVISRTVRSGGRGSLTEKHNWDTYDINGSIRRLTPIECERLQGLPDNWTKYGLYDGVLKEISDTQRYKLCGNGVSILIIELMGKALIKANSSPTQGG